MKSSILSLALLLAFGSVVANDLHGQKDPNEIRLITDGKRTLDILYQNQLREQPNWQNFLLTHGTWYVQFSETNAKPHKAFGKPIPVAGSTTQEKAINFLSQLSGFGIPFDELELTNVTTNEHGSHVFFAQRHSGAKVIGARLSVKLSTDGKVIGFGCDVYDHIQAEPAMLVAAAAESFAIAGIDGDVVLVASNPELMLLPIPNRERKMTEFRYVYEVIVNTVEDRIPARYLTYVDAIDGKIWMRKNLICHAENPTPGGVSVDVSGDLSLTQPYDPLTNSPLANMEVTQGGNTFYTDVAGHAEGLGIGNATFRLRGLWSEVFTNGVTPSVNVSLANGANAIDMGDAANSREMSAFYHVNVVHDYMKTKFPSFTLMDNPLETNVDVNGSCNAFYDGSSINFYLAGAGCNSFALVADVVYHEYGHGINDKYYQSQGGFWANGAMGEGYADLWALGITANPVLGLGNSQSLPDDYIRRYDIDPKVYPQDLVGEVHADGEIIAGAWWDLGQNFGDLQQMMDLLSATYDAVITGFDGNEGEVFVDILVEALQVDDSPANGGDNDITNGTPNDLDIINAFDAHGITLLSNATLSHSPIESHDEQSITVNMNVTLTYPWALQDALLSYRLNDSNNWSTVSMTNASGNTYSGNIPAQPNGTIVAYYVALQNLNGTLANVQPIAADLQEPNVPYYILVGYTQNHIEDFDTFQGSGWLEGLPTDNNSTGTWTIDVPIGSFSDDGVMVQTEVDHTAGSGNIACAITGNASSSSAGLGENDVDEGHTTLVTPIFDLSEFSDPAISYWRYYTNSPPSGANPGADWWQVLITDDGSNWVYVENSKVSDPSWRRVAIRVTDYVELTENVRVKFIASDSTRLGQNLDGGSLIEGAVDDVQIWEIVGGNQSGIDESGISQLSVYPNPSSGAVRISMNLVVQTNVNVQVIDLRGAMVFSRSLGRMTGQKQIVDLDLSALANGLYQLRLQTDRGSVTQQLELIH